MAQVFEVEKYETDVRGDKIDLVSGHGSIERPGAPVNRAIERC